MPKIRKTGRLSDLRSTEALIRFGDQLLKEERGAILSGAYEKLEELATRKAAFVEEIERRAVSIRRDLTSPERSTERDALHGIINLFARRAETNGSLLTSARRGAQMAISEATHAETANGFYDPSGSRISSSSARPTLAKV